MKKLIGIFGIAIIAMTMFFSTNTVNSSNENFDLASLVSLNTADAECNEWFWPYGCNAFSRCSSNGSGGGCNVR